MYLSRTGELGNIAAEAVLDYYMMEKALVGAKVGIFFDKKYKLGENFLKLSQKYAEKVNARLL